MANEQLRISRLFISNFGIIIVALFLLVFLSQVFFIVSPFGYSSDLALYHIYASNIWHGQIPYRDYLVEYPPGILPILILALGIGGLVGGYSAAFMILAMMAVGSVFYDQLKAWGLSRVTIITLILLPISTFLFTHLDTFVAVMLYWFIKALRQRRLNLAIILLATATLIKGYPIIFLPFIFIFSSNKKLLKNLFLYLFIVATTLAPFIFLATSGVINIARYHFERPIQLESSQAIVAYLLKPLGERVSVVTSHQSWGVVFSLSAIAGLVGLLLLIGLLLVTFYKITKMESRPVALLCIVVMVIFLVTFKVGSPQLLIPLFFIAILGLDELPSRLHKPYIKRLLLIGLANLLIYIEYVELLEQRWWMIALLIIKMSALVELALWCVKTKTHSQAKMLTKD